MQHLAGEMFQRLTGVQMLHVPYKGIGPAMNDLIGGQVQVSIESLAATAPHIGSGKLRALAVAAPQRVAKLPEVPTAAEAGIKGFEVAANLFAAAPAGTPAAVVAKVNGAMKDIFATRADVRDSLQGQFIVAGHQVPPEAARLVREEVARWAQLVTQADIKPE